LSAPNVIKSLLDNLFFNKKNNVYYSSFLRQQKFLNSTLALLKDNPAKLMQKLIGIRQTLVRPDNSMAFMSVELNRCQYYKTVLFIAAA
jgi:hypothetical protein